MQYENITPQTETEKILLQQIKELESRISKHEICPVYNILTRTALEERWNSIKQTPKLGIAFFDIDNLKKINERYGYDEADKMLSESFALARKHEAFGRFFSGDEFVIFAPISQILYPVKRIMGALRKRGMSATVAVALYKGEADLSSATKQAKDKVQQLKAANIKDILCMIDF